MKKIFLVSILSLIVTPFLCASGKHIEHLPHIADYPLSQNKSQPSTLKKMWQEFKSFCVYYDPDASDDSATNAVCALKIKELEDIHGPIPVDIRPPTPEPVPKGMLVCSFEPYRPSHVEKLAAMLDLLEQRKQQTPVIKTQAQVAAPSSKYQDTMQRLAEHKAKKAVEDAQEKEWQNNPVNQAKKIAGIRVPTFKAHQRAQERAKQEESAEKQAAQKKEFSLNDLNPFK